MSAPRIGLQDASANLTDVLLWSDNKAEKLTKYIELKQQWYKDNVISFSEDWRVNVFNIDTANEFGVSVWARILGIELSLNLGTSETKPVIGFKVEGDTQPFENFNNGNFTSRTGFHVGLTLELARLVVKLRYLKLIARPTVPYINRMLNIAFGKGNVYVLDDLRMEFVTYVFNREPGQLLRLLVEYFDLLPRPSCVGIRLIVDREGVFGFGEFNDNFEYSNFITED